MRVFFVVLARDSCGIVGKIRELDGLGYPYLVVCGEKLEGANILYRPPKGKYDAMNFGLNFVPSDTDVIAFNDVDTEIHNFDGAVDLFKDEKVSLAFVKVNVREGPQLTFYSLLDSLRRRLPVAASGELMLVRRSFVEGFLPIKGCKAEDSYLLFKVLEKGGRAVFCERCYVTTQRTLRAEDEEAYKRRTVGGIYQALGLAKPPMTVKLFYIILPFVSPLLLLLGKKGFYWSKGILTGYADYLRGDRTTSWQRTYA
jgi:hypothetical protein